MTGAFCLDERLAASTHEVARWALSCVLLKDDANFPWLILVPERGDLSELHDLKPGDLESVTDEIVRASRALQAVFKPDKINIAALGNQVRQLHIHVIARFTDDPAWPRPVWDAVPPRSYAAQDVEARVEALRAAFGKT
jgi:diadenosine tetraphosphate (Ap4A) HIT family hydrolase